MFKQHRIIALSILFMLLLVLNGCGGPALAPTPTPEAIAAVATPVINIQMNPDNTKVSVGGQVAISVEATGENLKIEWSAGKGELSRTEGPSVIYTAPATGGIDTVDITVTTASGSTTRTITFTVEAQPTNTPALVLTDTPVVTEAPTVTLGPVTLTTLFNEQTIPCENLAKGTYTSEITDPIWPVVYVASRYHPQDEGGKAPPKSNGAWFGTVRFGDCNKPAENIGKAFQLIIVTAGLQCNQAFEDYISESRATGRYPGLLDLPEDCVEHVRIVVTRK